MAIIGGIPHFQTYPNSLDLVSGCFVDILLICLLYDLYDIPKDLIHLRISIWLIFVDILTIPDYLLIFVDIVDICFLK